VTQPYQLLPSLTADEYEALRADIASRGVMVPVELDDDGHILDGHHRAGIAVELGLDYPTVIRSGWTEDEKVAHVLAMNLARRQLTREQRAGVVAELRRRRMSTRKIAAAVGVDHSTVVRDLESIGADAPMPEAVETSDGRTYPARRPAADLELTDAHRAKFPELAHADLRVELTQALYAFGKPGKFNSEDWADRVDELRPEDVALVRQHLAYIRRWLDKWDRLLDRPALSLVERSHE
jgi:ParB-like chromosome segregation protein Spo0J